MFSTGFQVYTLDDNEVSCRSVRLLRHPLPGMDRVVNVHLEGDQHFRPIEDLRMYARCYKCMHCGSQWSALFRLERHQANCQWVSHYRYKGRPYRSKPRFYELMAPLGVVVAPEHRYHLYKATFDLEACLVPVSEGIFTSQHVPMSVSLASNVPGYEGPYNFISNRCPQRLVDDMMSCLWDMSDTTYHLMREAMDPYYSQLDDLSFRHGKGSECTWDLKTEAGRMLSSSTGARALTKVRRSLEQWMRCMPVVSFNGGRYHLQLIKPYLAAVNGTYGPPWLGRSWANEGPELLAATDGMSPGNRGGDEITSILKKGSLFTAIYTHKLAFLDVCNYLPAGGFSYAKYLWNYGGPAARAENHFSLMNIWTTWPACETLARLCHLLLITVWREHPGGGPGTTSWPTELC